jgi:flagellar FliL protein
MDIEDDVDDRNEDAPPAKGRSSLVTLLLVSLLSSLVVSCAVGGGLYFLFKPALDAQKPAEEEVAEEEEDDGPRRPPIYFSLEEPFIVNLSTEPARFLQVTVELMTRDEDVEEALGQHRPLLRNNLLLLFSSATADSIGTPEGKQALRRDALAEVQDVLEDLDEPSSVEDLYFTSLVVQ